MSKSPYSIILFLILIFSCSTDTEQFFKAVREGNTEKVSEFLEQGTDINARDENGQTALIASSISGNEEMVQILLDSGADILKTDSDGRNAYELAVENSNYKATIVLLSHGEPVQEKYWVTDTSGLPLFNQPGGNGVVLADLQFTDEITVIRKSYIETEEGRWVEAEYGNKTGWILYTSSVLTNSRDELFVNIGGKVSGPDRETTEITVTAEEITEGRTYTETVVLNSEETTADYSLYVLPGTYIIYSYPASGEDNGSRHMGYYTAYAAGDNSGEHFPVMLKAEAGESISNINITDWYTNRHDNDQFKLLKYFRFYNTKLTGIWHMDDPETYGTGSGSTIQFCRYPEESPLIQDPENYSGRSVIVLKHPETELFIFTVNEFYGIDDKLILSVDYIEQSAVITVEFVSGFDIHVVITGLRQFTEFDEYFVLEKN